MSVGGLAFVSGASTSASVRRVPSRFWRRWFCSVVPHCGYGRGRRIERGNQAELLEQIEANENLMPLRSVSKAEPAGVEPVGVEPVGVEPVGVEPAGVDRPL